jgi:hypothetical protein
LDALLGTAGYAIGGSIGMSDSEGVEVLGIGIEGCYADAVRRGGGWYMGVSMVVEM